MSAAAFALIAGAAYAAAGVLGFIPQFAARADAPLSVLYLAVGVWGLVAAAGKTSTVVYARALAVLFGALAVLGLVPGLEDSLSLASLQGYSVWLHGATALVAAFVGLRSRSEAALRSERRSSEERRRVMHPVARERRRPGYERRRGYGGTLAAG